ncbi:hypothetical protein [Saccharomonospora sp. CUA-673]|uniref:hypothetical protein n=1 Tax=Saccharomonospora sp. CUA-673 TaxID=1904969 RepID=UPI001301535F|nr:hypothetical protein [Saccharomonospora sp. CUA-673]
MATRLRTAVWEIDVTGETVVIAATDWKDDVDVVAADVVRRPTPGELAAPF